MVAHDPLLPRIENALLLEGISATRLGYLAAGDPALVKKMRAGRHVKKPALRRKIDELLTRVEAGESLG